MESIEEYQVLFGGFIFGCAIYWLLHQSIEHGFRILAPNTYSKLNADRMAKLQVCVSMIARAVIGALFTVPSCLIAARDTPWEYGQRMSIPGSICVVSQAVPFISELQLQLETSFQVLIHHLLCLVIMGNVLAFPKVHMVKPLYIFFASQMGDVSVAVYKCCRALGVRPRDSWYVYATKLWSTAVLVFSKTASAFYCANNILTSPNRLLNWIWMFCMVFFCVYNSDRTGFNMAYIGLATAAREGPRGIIFLHRYRISRFRMAIAFAIVAAIMIMTLTYAFILQRKLRPGELGLVWLTAILFAIVASVITKTSVYFWGQYMGGIGLLPETDDTALRGCAYIRLGTVLLCGIISAGTVSATNGFISGFRLSPAALAGAAAMTLIMWDSMMRLAIYASIDNKERRACMLLGSKVSPQAKVPSPQTHMENSSHQLGMVWVDVFTLGGGLSLRELTFDTCMVMLVAHALAQCMSELQIRRRRVRESSPKESHATRSMVTARTAMAATELGLAAAAVWGSMCRAGCGPGETDLLYRALTIGILAGTSKVLISAALKKTKRRGRPRLSSCRSTKPSPLRHLKVLLKPQVFTCPLAFMTQYAAILPVMGGSDYTIPEATSIGFQNVLKVMGSPLFMVGGMIGLHVGVLALSWCG